MRVLLALLIVVSTTSGGCLDLFGRALDDHDVARSPVDTQGWNRDGIFTVQVREVDPVEVRIEATATTGQVLAASGLSNATLPAIELAIPDGTWTITYYLDGTRWETFKEARFDSTPPTVTGLESVGSATASGSYLLGSQAQVEAGATIQVIAQATGQTVATALPYQVAGLADGVHAYDVVVRDRAGNEAGQTVQVRAGSAQALPEGKHDLGLVARYTLDAELWSIEGLDQWITPAQARQAASNQWLGAGKGITPDAPAVVAVVDEVVIPGMSTGRAAMALFQWMADELDYDKTRLGSSILLTPSQTILDSEDASAQAEKDLDQDGLVPDGSGNGQRGGVCRDLAGLYVSLLRAADIPARLVTGYLGGEVNGFHAWVEFYGGPGHGPSPWVPVDVSAIGSTDDPAPYSPDIALQAFGIRHTSMLPLRVMSETQEEGNWATAVAVHVSYPPGQEPSIDLAKSLTPESPPSVGVLCVDRDTLARLDVRRAHDCPASFPLYLGNFTRSASLILDYGATITASPGTQVTLTLSYPDPAAVAPGTVEQQTYGSTFRAAGEGLKEGVWNS